MATKTCACHTPLYDANYGVRCARCGHPIALIADTLTGGVGSPEWQRLQTALGACVDELNEASSRIAEGDYDEGLEAIALVAGTLPYLVGAAAVGRFCDGIRRQFP